MDVMVSACMSLSCGIQLEEFVVRRVGGGVEGCGGGNGPPKGNSVHDKNPNVEMKNGATFSMYDTSTIVS